MKLFDLKKNSERLAKIRNPDNVRLQTRKRQTAVCGLRFPMKVHYGLCENGAFATQLLRYKLSAQRLRVCLGGQALVAIGSSDIQRQP